MRVYVGERDESGSCRVWVAHEEPRPDIREVVEVLGDLNRLVDLRRDGMTGEDYEAHRARSLARKDEILEQIRQAENLPAPVALVHRGVHTPHGFNWGDRGPGAADLAYSILLTELGEPPTDAMCDNFRCTVVANLDETSFRLTSTQVWDWILVNRPLVEAELFGVLPEGEDRPALAVVGKQLPHGEADVEEATGSAVVRACEQAWGHIQRHHPDLPDVVVVLGTGVERGRLVKLGHWWGGRWIADGQARGEVLLAGEALHLPPAQVFEVLLHEAAHGLNAARRIPDTSRGGRYHNRRFAATAAEVLLDAEQMPPYGFAATKLTPAAEERYAPTIERLGEAMRIARQIGRGVQMGAETGGQLGGDRDGITIGREGKRAAEVTAQCGCGRRLRMAPSVFAKGPVTCALCGSEFRDGAERRQGAEPDSEVVDRTFLDRRRAALEGETSSSSRQNEAASLLDGQRARLDAALAAAPEPDMSALRPLQQRLDDLQELTALLEATRSPRPELTPVQAEGINELLSADVDEENVVALERWYHRFGTPDETPMALRGDVPALTDLARALLKVDGTLREPRVQFGDGDLLVGDRVITTRDVPAFGLSAGVPGTVDAIDPHTGGVEVDFATSGRFELSVGELIDAGITHDYATTEVAASPEIGVSVRIAVEANRIEPGMGL